jgi:hypothetical protein
MTTSSETPAFTVAALKNLEGYAPAERERMIVSDMADLRHGRLNREDLLARCLNGAEPEWVEGWHDYVAALVSVIG